LVGQETVAFQVFPERDHLEGGLGLTLGEPIITPVILMERLQKPGRVCLDAFATHPLTGVAGTALTALLEQLALEPPGPSTVALKVVLALVAQVLVRCFFSTWTKSTFFNCIMDKKGADHGHSQSRVEGSS
jgi:hypothetical protein